LGHTYTVVISFISLATSLIAMAAVDNWGRKPLVLIGSTGMGVCLFSLAAAVPRHFAPGFYLSVLVAYNVFFAFSQGTVVWVYLSELFPPGIRGAGLRFVRALDHECYSGFGLPSPAARLICPNLLFFCAGDGRPDWSCLALVS
jgi:MFS family permease